MFLDIIDKVSEGKVRLVAVKQTERQSQRAAGLRVAFDASIRCHIRLVKGAANVPKQLFIFRRVAGLSQHVSDLGHYLCAMREVLTRYR